MKHAMGGIALAVLGWLGCGGGGGDVELEDLGSAVGGAICPKIFECCSAEEVAEQFEGFNPPIDSVEDCENFYSGIVSAFLVPQIRASIDAGRVEYHPDIAGDCVERIEELSCADYATARASDDFVPGCDNPIEPLVELGGACSNDDECKSRYCSGATSFPGEEGEDGTCAERPGLGDPCEFECEPGSYCGFDQASGESRCQPTLGEGSDCSFDDECESQNCSGGNPSEGVPGTCSSDLTCSGN